MKLIRTATDVSKTSDATPALGSPQVVDLHRTDLYRFSSGGFARFNESFLHVLELRPTFSGTAGHQHYLMMPGGEDAGSGATEWVGEANQKCYGTSVAAAYASAVLGLFMSDPKHHKPTREQFLDAVLNTCQPCNNQNAGEHGLGYLPYS